jgi:hypothetical protein
LVCFAILPSPMVLTKQSDSLQQRECWNGRRASDAAKSAGKCSVGASNGGARVLLLVRPSFPPSFSSLRHVLTQRGRGRLADHSTLLSDRLTILREVFTRLVAESGVSFVPPPPPSSSSASISPPAIDETAKNAPERLLDLLLVAGSPTPTAFPLSTAAAEDDDDVEETLPAPLQPIMVEWRKQQSSSNALKEGGEEGRKKVGRTRTV